ncbi:hypothetical protein [Streptomyces sp. NPDC020298]|uniref:hypothetical protein n=1 Tax=unclassified Streptomyces TaxID=2593676 RepID=UPI0033D6D325
MASLLGSSIPLDCPACEEPVTVPVRQVGAARSSVTVTIDMSSFRAHIADAHPTAREELAGEP